MDDVIEIAAEFVDGKMILSRIDGQPISVITHEELDSKCIEVLEFGCRGNAVKALQALLNCHGAHLEIDGIFGTYTQTALMIYQDAQKLSATGTCSMLEWEKLINEN